MEDNKIVIDKSKLWTYDESKYTEEFLVKLREERIKANHEILDNIEKRKKEAEKKPPEQRPGYIINKQQTEAKENGEIIDVFIRQRLAARITAMRWGLALGMAITFLFKGQWIIWIILIALYNLLVRQMKKEALKVDRERWEKEKNERMG